MNIYESAEDYLEAILILRERQGAVRSIDVVHQLELTKPSVSVAMKNLRQKNYITVSEDGFIRLTDTGRSLAEAVYERHSLLSEWLIHLGVNPDTAVADACRMEHDMSPESFEAIKKYLKDPSRISLC